MERWRVIVCEETRFFLIFSQENPTSSWVYLEWVHVESIVILKIPLERKQKRKWVSEEEEEEKSKIEVWCKLEGNGAKFGHEMGLTLP